MGTVNFEPHRLSYWKLHFGTDVLMSCWFLLLSTLFFTIIPIQMLIDSNSSTPTVKLVYYSCFLISGALYLIGTIAFLAVSYPEAMEELMQSMTKMDPSKMSFWEKYFYGNSLLIMTWFFALATLPIVIYYVYGMIEGSVSIAYGVLAMIASFVAFGILFIWVVATFPENIIKNEGRGSQYVLEFMSRNKMFCGREEFWSYHFQSDFLVGSWAFLLISALALPGAIYFFVMNPTTFEYYMLLLSSTFFVLGSILLVHASYPGNFTSDLSWRILTCTYRGEDVLFSSQIPRTSEEEKPLTENVNSSSYTSNPLRTDG